MNKYIDLTCAVCGNLFSRLLKQHKYAVKEAGDTYSPLCSAECKKKFRATKVEVACENCGKIFSKSPSQILKTDHNFCSRSCFVSSNNMKVSRSKYPDKLTHCVKCDTEVMIKANASRNNVLCEKCKGPRKLVVPRVWKRNPVPVLCVKCDDVISVSWTKRKYCPTCLIIARKEAGLKSVQAQSASRRSKSEIYFAELCRKEFSSVTTNDPIFQSKYGNWDADVIIHDYKIAVLWNGVWHYKQVRKGHSVKQVRARDKIKLDVITANGFTPYVIADMGKHNKAFVEAEFEKFKEFLHNRS